MTNWKNRSQRGFSLLEMAVAIIIVGILLAVAMQSMTSVVGDVRQTRTERELELLAKSIVGDPNVTQGGGRADFGYVGDIGSFPTNLDALYNNPGSYSTWDGPYLPQGFTQDSTGLKTDEWGTAYNYSGGITITSTGSGSTITKKIARATSDYLLNQLNGIVKDAADSVPGTTFKDSVDIEVTIPDGIGATVTKTYSPDSAGAFTLDSLPSGKHTLRIIHTPAVDTIFRYITIFPRHKSDPYTFKFGSDHFTDTSGGGGGADTVRDELNAVAYNGNDGTVNWTDDWQEDNEVDGPTTGILRVVSTHGGAIRIGHDDIEDEPVLSLTREADLSGATTATLTYDYEAVNIDNNGPVDVRISGNGGSTWTTLASYSPNDGSGSESFDISTYIASDTQVRLEVSDKFSMYLYVDNIQIAYQ